MREILARDPYDYDNAEAVLTADLQELGVGLQAMKLPVTGKDVAAVVASPNARGPCPERRSSRSSFVEAGFDRGRPPSLSDDQGGGVLYGFENNA